MRCAARPQVEYQQLTRGPEGEIFIHVTDNSQSGTQDVVVVDKLLVAAGHKPNVENMGLELAGGWWGRWGGGVGR